MSESAPIGIIGATTEEVERLVAKLTDVHKHAIAGMTFCEGLLNGSPVVVVQCGIGKVNAAICAQALIDRFAPRAIINTGAAGAFDPTLDIGDLVISVDAVQHDMDVTGLGFEPGVIPHLETSEFKGDERILQAVCTAAREVAPQLTVRRGRIASGDQFVCTTELRNRILDLFAPHCVEMEGAAIAQACYRNEVPFAVVRAISDKADNSSTVTYNVFKEEAARNGAAIVERAVALLA